MTTLGRIIADKIRHEGPLSFRDYMEMALYYPGLGYYTSQKPRIGTGGDYFTSCTLSPLFGNLLARQLHEMWELMDVQEFTILECGAGTGHLCKAILDYFRNETRLYDRLNYVVVERKGMEEAAWCGEHQGKVICHDTLSAVKDLTGCVLSNELLDNFAVHRVLMRGELMEICVDCDSTFRETLRPASSDLKDYFKELRVQLPEGTMAEVNLDAREWIGEIAKRLRSGYVITIDYGYPSGELHQPHRRDGTLVCYRNHKVSGNFYNDIGESDITAHVNFSALCLWGNNQGLAFTGFREQGAFLQALGFFDCLKSRGEATNSSIVHRIQNENLLIRTLLEDMGRKFKVLVMQKELPENQLKGFQMLRAQSLVA